ncbi:MAG TPA: hypothetical protein PKA62_10960 [Thermoanaerobaculia bacterium]|nr:hypothetical protein [Thermoanaerobaculia bacterium]
MSGRAERSSWPVRRIALADEGQGPDPVVAAMTPAERIALVERLTRNAWAFKGERIDGARLRRDVVRTRRGGG